jgi:hypothetical protein
MALLSEEILENVKNEIENQFPEMKDVEPREEKFVPETESRVYKKLGVSLPKTFITEDIFRLSFEKTIKTEDGFEMQKIVKVLVNKEGKILKISTSK